MADESPYNKREMDNILEQINVKLDRIEQTGIDTKAETKKTNGRVNKLERNLLIVGAIVLTMLVTSGAEVIDIVKAVFV